MFPHIAVGIFKDMTLPKVRIEASADQTFIEQQNKMGSPENYSSQTRIDGYRRGWKTLADHMLTWSTTIKKPLFIRFSYDISFAQLT